MRPQHILFDTNVVLDVLLNRQPWVIEAQQLWDLMDEGQIQGYVSAITLSNMFYLARKLKGLEVAYELVWLCLDTFEICPVDRPALEAAAHIEHGGTSDFEDNIQIVNAVDKNVNGIVTRDKSGFRSSAVPVFTPVELLDQVRGSNPS